MPKADRTSLQYADYDDEGITASKDRMNSKFIGDLSIPIELVSNQVFAPNISNEETSELLSIVSSVSLTFETKEFGKNYHFEPTGCEWKVILPNGPKEEYGDQSTNYWVHCMIVEDGDSLETSFNVEMSLMAPTNDRHVRATAERFAKSIFNDLKCAMRKELARLEFPVFPHGPSGVSFRSTYQLNQELNEGSFGVVFRGRHRKTDDVVAVKSINCKKLSPEDDAAIFTEVALMANMDHPHIIKVIDFFEEQGHYLMVLEYLEGGDLFDRIGKKSAYSEDDARTCSKILLESIAYCHANNVAHLDLKSKNLVLTSPDDDTKIKLIDFGFAQRVTGPNCLTRRCGTPYFVAPEIIRKEAYDQRADMWSVGVIIHLLLSGHLPFQGRNAMELFKNVLKGKLDFKETNWSLVSPDAIEVLKHLLDTDPETRWSAERVLSSRWFRQDSGMLKSHDLYASSRGLKLFNAKMKLRASVHAIGVANSLGKTFMFKDDSTKQIIEEDQVDTNIESDED